MNIFLLSVSVFLLTLFLINLFDFIKNRQFNSWLSGFVDKIELAGEQEIWTIRWSIPDKLKDSNPGDNGFQYFYFKFLHHNDFNNVDERNNYLNQKSLNNVGNKFYLILKVDSSGVIRNVNKYNGYLQRTVGYGLLFFVFLVSIYFLKYR